MLQRFMIMTVDTEIMTWEKDAGKKMSISETP